MAFLGVSFVGFLVLAVADSLPILVAACVCIGAGQGGGPLAGALARAGRRVALVERDHVGGTCINTGCTPTKTMVASAEVAHLARRAADFGVEAGHVRVDMERVRQRTHRIVESFRNGSRSGLEAQDGLDLVFGVARMTGPRRLEVTTPGGRATLEADTIVINTGQRPGIPSIDGLAEAPFLTNETIIDIDYLPRHLIVLGGGYVGLEFAQMFRRFGSEVTIVQRGPQIASREDADVADTLTGILREDGIEVLTDAEASKVSARDTSVELDIDREGSHDTVRGSHLLVATGRTPNTDELGLDAAGVETDERGYVRVDEQLRTNVDGVYAIGDVRGGPAFTHMSYDDYRIVRADRLGDEPRSTAERTVP
jgi:pyruvate/2-oxoglutarate dehydrogenase complex dihydrolipoamide dehydrogenase (E3) component